MMDATCRVVDRTQLDDQNVILTLQAPELASVARPGQFVMLSSREGTEPLLRRPFGIMDATASVFRVFFEIVGSGTRILSMVHPGDSIQALGPLGNTFPEVTNRRILAIAGGRGIAPLLFSLKHLSPTNHMVLLYGARGVKDLHLREEISHHPLKESIFCTENGDFGHPGQVTAVLKELLERHRIDMTLSCGPHAMLAAMDEILESWNSEDYMSAEALMGCGFGACHSCVIPATEGGYRRVCQEGPVFSRKEIQWRT